MKLEFSRQVFERQKNV